MGAIRGPYDVRSLHFSGREIGFTTTCQADYEHKTQLLLAIGHLFWVAFDDELLRARIFTCTRKFCVRRVTPLGIRV